MEGLLHWDFNPGLTVAAQVRRRFGTTVHFSPSNGSKEFFLVVYFSSAFSTCWRNLWVLPFSAALVVYHLDSMSCFWVIDDFVFRWPPTKWVISSYHLKDQIWPDFVCHFQLFRPNVLDYSMEDDCWHSDERISKVSTRSPIAIKSSLGLISTGDQFPNPTVLNLQHPDIWPMPARRSSPEISTPATKEPTQTVLDNLRNSMNDIQCNGSFFGLKFGNFIVNWGQTGYQSIQDSHHLMQTNIHFGNLSTKVCIKAREHSRRFEGRNFKQGYWNSIPTFIISHILDQLRFGYTPQHIATIWSLQSTPDRLHFSEAECVLYL